MMTDDGKLKGVLERAGHDLDNAQLPGFVNWAFAPFREILTPIVNTASNVVPTIPVVDDVTAFFLEGSFNVIRFAYSASLVTQSERFKNTVQDEAATNATLSMTKRGKQETQQSGIISWLFGSFGFGFNALLDFAFNTGQKLSDRTLPSLQLFGYLMYSGIGSELSEAFLRPGATSDIRIMGNVQAQNTASRREKAAASGVTDFPFNDAWWYMRYATAAYGLSMMEPAERLITFKPSLKSNPQWSIFDFVEHIVHKTSSFVLHSWDKVNKSKIERYINIKPYEMLYITPLYVGGSSKILYITPLHVDGSTKILRHFVAVDTQMKAVVLAIRGTFTVSAGVVTDLDGTTVPFCGGLAHKGIGEMAAAILENEETLSAIRSALSRYETEGYELIITGHSLGAGTACLVNIKAHYDNLFPTGTKIRCFGYASPPVYAAYNGATSNLNVTNHAVLEAIDNTTCYIHEEDCVPFMSVDAVVRLAYTVDKLHQEDKKLKFFDRWLMASGRMDPTQDIVDVVENGARDLKKLDTLGTARLYVPAKTVLWMYKWSTSDPEGFSFQYSSPVEIADLNILLSPKMIADHMPAQYEDALDAVIRVQQRRRKSPRRGMNELIRDALFLTFLQILKVLLGVAITAVPENKETMLGAIRSALVRYET